MKTSRSRHTVIRGRVLASSLLLTVIGAAAATPLAHASPAALTRPEMPGSGAPVAGRVSWSVSPATAKAPDSRIVFNYQNVAPGSVITDHVAVFNRSAQSVAFSVYATDAAGTTAGGALTLLPANARSTDIGSWATFSGHVGQLSVIIPGGKGIIEPFTVAVPRQATPGDHTGGMVVAVGEPRRNAAGQIVTLYERIAVPIELRVTGKLTAGLRVESISTGFHNGVNPFGGGSAGVTYLVVNTGNVRLGGTQVVAVTGPFGIKSTIRPPALPVVLPGDSVQVAVSPGGLYPAGSLTAHVTVTPTWPKGAIPLAVPLIAESDSAPLFAIPWALLGLIILLAGGGYGGLRAWRWRRRAHRAEVAAAAERARIETERRLLGSKNLGSKNLGSKNLGSKNGKSAAAAAQPASKTPAGGPDAGSAPE